MDSQTRQRVRKRIEELGVGRSPNEQEIRQAYSKAKADLSGAKEAVESAEAEGDGGFKYVANSLYMDLKLIKEEKGRENYTNLVSHAEDLREIYVRMHKARNDCLEAEALLEWIDEKREENSFKIELEQDYEEAKVIVGEIDNLLSEIEGLARKRLKTVEKVLELVESDERNAWNGSSSGLEHAREHLVSIVRQDSDQN